MLESGDRLGGTGAAGGKMRCCGANLTTPLPRVLPALEVADAGIPWPQWIWFLSEV